jgi:hypothetical protein
MADKLGVALTCIVKTVFDKTLSDPLKKYMGGEIKTAINKSSKLQVVSGAPDKGFDFTATLELTKDDNAKPVQIKGTIAMAIIASGLTAGTINLKTPAEGDAGSNPAKYKDRAQAVIDGILGSMMPKVIKAMEDKVPK